MSMYTVTIWYGKSQSLYHDSQIFVGLNYLARKSAIRLHWLNGVPPEWNALRNAEGPPIFLRVAKLGGSPILCCIDLHDDGYRFNAPALQVCDVYLKRGYDPAGIARLPLELSSKVRPFGLNYPCRDAHPLSLLLRWGRQQLTRFSESGQIKSSFAQLRTYLTLPRSEDYERRPEEPLKPIVLFQTRVWEAQEVVPDDADEVNDARVNLIRVLRAALGDRFRGGLIPTPYAIKRYPKLVVKSQYRRSDYIAMSRQCLIGVYARGLHHSNAFKLGEYLAAGQCIVGHRLRQQLPQPLVEGKHYLPFVTPEECVAHCERILSDPTFANAMSSANHEYYIWEVEPAAHMLRCLERVTC